MLVLSESRVLTQCAMYQVDSAPFVPSNRVARLIVKSAMLFTQLCAQDLQDMKVLRAVDEELSAVASLFVLKLEAELGLHSSGVQMLACMCFFNCGCTQAVALNGCLMSLSITSHEASYYRTS
jgi:hypothetical protein